MSDRWNARYASGDVAEKPPEQLLVEAVRAEAGALRLILRVGWAAMPYIWPRRVGT